MQTQFSKQGDGEIEVFLLSLYRKTHFPSGNNQCIAISAVLVNGEGISLMKFSSMEHGLMGHQGLPRKNGG